MEQPRPGARPDAPPSRTPRPRNRPTVLRLPIPPVDADHDIHERSVTASASRMPPTNPHTPPVPSNPPSQGSMFFAGLTDASFGGGQFSNHQGDVNIYYHNSNNPPAGGQGNLGSPDLYAPPQGDPRDSQPPGPSRRRRRPRNGQARPEAGVLGLVQRSNKIYESHLILKGRGYPLWIPQQSLCVPVPYRAKGISIGDVGIITQYGSFDFLFNICMPSDHPMNSDELPDGFRPIHPPLKPMDIRQLQEFGSGSFLASSSVAKVYHEVPSGLSFETSDPKGAILAMPDGAYHEELVNVSGFRDYIAKHIANWYKFVNGPLGREAKNGDIRLVVGCDKSTTWGMAVFDNRSRTKSRLKLSLNQRRQTSSGCKHVWEHSDIDGEVRVGPEDGENDELGATPQRLLRNQCLFVRTLNVTLPDHAWAKLDSVLSAVRQQKSSDSDSNFTGSSRTSQSHVSGGGSPSSNLSDSMQNDKSGQQLSDKPPKVDEEASRSDSGSSCDSVIVTHFDTGPYKAHPSKILNESYTLKEDGGLTLQKLTNSD